MSHDATRGGDNVAAVPPNQIPRAPPLPAPRPFQGVRHAAYRIIGLPSRPPSPQHGKVDAHLPPASFGRFAALGATQDATTSHKTGLEINTLAINGKGTHALLGGKELFKTLKIHDGVCVEELNLRTAIRSTPTSASGKPRQVYSIDIADVAWAKGDSGDYIAAATSSGKIILYDLGHGALQAALLHEHYRQVHKVTFNPHRANLLLSGSQDGTVRLWDVRDARTHASSLQSKRKFSGQSDGVRDVKWSPTEGVDFAFGTDSGWVQRWDIRNLKTPKVRVPAHQMSCNSVDWHPDGKHLMTTGTDKAIRIWDFSTAKIKKPTEEIKAPYPVMNARWRPSCESSMPQDQGARLCAQLVTTYDRDHPIVHVWDLRRPLIPFRQLQPGTSAPTDLVWHSQDLLWTVGLDGIFLQTDIHHVPKVLDRRSLQAIATSSSGELRFAIQQRYRRPSSNNLPVSLPKSPTASLSQSPESSLLSRSWADDSLDYSFLTVLPRRRASSTRTPRYSTSTTPPSGLPSTSVMKLDDILFRRKSYAPQQAAFRAALPFQVNATAAGAMASQYMAALSYSTADEDPIDCIQAAFDRCALAARSSGQYRLAQTWSIAAYACIDHLRKRMQTQRGKKTLHLTSVSSVNGSLRETARYLLEHTKSPTISPVVSPKTMRPISSIAQALAVTESTSNAATPLARPVSHDKDGMFGEGHPQLPDPEQDGSIALLPPSITSRHQAPDADATALKRPLTEYNLQNLQQLHQPVDEGTPSRKWTAHPSGTLGGLPGVPTDLLVRPSLVKHNSNESFSFLAGSNSSRDPSLPASLTGSDDGPASMVMERPTRHARQLPVVVQPEPETHQNSPSVDSGKIAAPTEVASTPDSPIIFTDRRTTQILVPPVGRLATTMNADATILKASADIDVETDEPFAFANMLRELVRYYSDGLANAQTAAQLLLMFVPLLPRTSPLTKEAIERTILHYAENLASNGFASDDIPGFLESVFGHTIHAGIHPLQIESILSTYHDELQGRRLFTEAAFLRRLAYPAFPAVYGDASEGDNFYLSCGTCGKRMRQNDPVLQCSNCAVKPAPCPVCQCRDSPFADGLESSNVLSTCMLCNHSCHTSCSREWFIGSRDAGCPVQGCLCDCGG